MFNLEGSETMQRTSYSLHKHPFESPPGDRESDAQDF